MDKVVDHLLVFKGQGEIKDFPGNYTQYREWEKTLKTLPQPLPVREGSGHTSNGKDLSTPRPNREGQGGGSSRRRLSYKEKRELEQLEKDIEALEAEKKQIEEALCGGTTSVEEITKLSKRLPQLNEELDEKSMRWLELSEIES